MPNGRVPPLPQELIDLIVDEVASQDLPTTLRACALVCQSFCYRSRKHLFSDIRLALDKHVQSRAGELLRILTRPRNDVWFANLVRSLTIIVIVDKEPDQPIPTLREFITGFFIREENYLLKLVDLLAQTSLTSFAMHAECVGVFRANSLTRKIVQMVSTAPSLKFLELSHIRGVDESIIKNALRYTALQELVLQTAGLSPSLSRQLKPSSQEWSDLAGESLLAQILEGFATMTHPSVTSARLKRVVLASPYDSTTIDILQEVMVEFARTLEALEIHGFPYDNRGRLERLELHQLTSLRHLKLVVSTFAYYQSDLNNNHWSLCQLLSSRNHAVRIQYLDIQFDIQLAGEHYFASQTRLGAIPTWPELDDILVGSFLNLRQMNFTFKLYDPPRWTVQGCKKLCDFRDSKDFLPRASAKFALNLIDIGRRKRR